MKNTVRLVSPYDSSHAYGPNMQTAFLVQTPEELIEYMQSCFKDKKRKIANCAEFSNKSWLSLDRKGSDVKSYGPFWEHGFMSLYRDLKEAFEKNYYFEVQLSYCWTETDPDFPNYSFFHKIEGNLFRGHVVDRI